MTVGERIKNLRIAHDMKQEELAKIMNISRATVSSWEVGRTEPNIEAVERLSTVFGCLKTDIIGEDSIDYLITSGNDEYMLLQTYRNADNMTKEMVNRLLFVKEYKEK